MINNWDRGVKGTTTLWRKMLKLLYTYREKFSGIDENNIINILAQSINLIITNWLLSVQEEGH